MSNHDSYSDSVLVATRRRDRAKGHATGTAETEGESYHRCATWGAMVSGRRMNRALEILEG
jgi:hypothetical protein